ncbi:hypothetical protein BV372_09565 [Nostoc sp. T09]|uniref:ParB/Srx family N-terminal domain-containing protein n=1 Tax=Nostoc sp. T09 TaxID=1932621 RepID=UPI000A36B92B|nr:ParB/Srx family N-terminal domain-containing protein [Nostoc sp. T09]OUL35829.1 hypothetical protein BV372_09565 [Nostoc sp. T09]
MTEFFMLDVSSITSSVSRSNFQEADLENLADMILESGGILKPLVLKKIGFEKYEVIDGHFEYYASVRAKEKNPNEGEMVNALIISPEKEEKVLKQASALRGIESNDKTVKSLTEPTQSTQPESLRLANLELRLEKQLNELKSGMAQERQRIDDKFKKIENLIPQQTDPLNLLNTLDKDQLYVKLQRSRITGAETLAKAIVDARLSKKNKQGFDDYRDVVQSVKGLGEKKILIIIDEWSRNK